VRVCNGTALLAGNVEEHEVLSGDDVGHSVAIISHRAKAAARTDAVRVLLQVHLGSLSMGCLTGGQAPGLAEHFLQEGRVQFQVLGHDVEAKEVAVDTLAARGVLVAQLVPRRCHLEHAQALIQAVAV